MAKNNNRLVRGGGGGGLPTPIRIDIWGKTRFSTKGEKVLPQDQIKKEKSRT